MSRIDIGRTPLNAYPNKAVNPPIITAGVFKNTPIASATLRVPTGSKALYQAAEGWKDFGTIEEF